MPECAAGCVLPPRQESHQRCTASAESAGVLWMHRFACGARAWIALINFSNNNSWAALRKPAPFIMQSNFRNSMHRYSGFGEPDGKNTRHFSAACRAQQRRVRHQA